ncbi:uncharacterized protein [Mytilus edulis]|uniref:uncharacterized protein n=1 Tax=Mytilus edulis TaxID=6550 RepID=UPI0039F0D2AF
MTAKSYCKSPGKDYTCLFDTIRHTYAESCNGPKQEPSGEKTVINSNNFDTALCISERYQPFRFTTIRGSDCIYKKAMCNEEGQFIYTEGSGKLDRTCRCDHREGYAFVTSPGNDPCACYPGYNDCSCYFKLCTKGQILSPDYQCINKYLNKEHRCSKVFGKQPNATNGNKAIKTASNKSDELRSKKASNSKIAAAVTFTLVVISILLVVIFFWKSSYIEEKIYKNSKQIQNSESIPNDEQNTKPKNVVVVGDGFCGKTCLLFRFKDGKFKEFIPTCFETTESSVKLDEKMVDLKLFDTAGQESYESLRKLAYPIADVFLVCFAIDNQDSFSNVADVWFHDLESHCPEIPRILVGNKKDVRTDDQIKKKLQKDKKSMITTETAKSVIGSLNMIQYLECSAKTSEGVETVFREAARAASATRAGKEKGGGRKLQ